MADTGLVAGKKASARAMRCTGRAPARRSDSSGPATHRSAPPLALSDIAAELLSLAEGHPD